MSQISSGFNPASQGPHRTAQGPKGVAYIPTDDEKRVFRECNRESFWYRSVPFSAIAVAVTQVMVTRGVLAPSPRLGSFPKVALAGVLGYIGGKVSYMQVCRERFKKLENSPIGEALRQGHLRHIPPELNHTEFAVPNQPVPEQPGFESTLQPTAESSSPPNPYSSYSSDYSYSSPSQSHHPTPLSSEISETAEYSSRDGSVPPVPAYEDEDTPKKRSVLYEELRSKNRENYEVSLTQKAETLLKPPAEVTPPKAEADKKNKYGDTWEE